MSRGFRAKRPFLMPLRSRTDQLACDPRSYIRAWASDGRPLYAPCLAQTQGPMTLADTGDGTYDTLFGSDWLFEICDSGDWKLYQRATDQTLTLTAWDVEPPTVGITARHPSAAFDQAARPALCWEEADGIHLRQYDEVTSVYAFTGPYAGVDPVLWNDSTANGHVPGSDLILFYLSADRLTIKYRIQNENFGTEHDLETYSEAMVLDGIELLALRYQLKYGLHDGGTRDTDSDPHAWRSTLYGTFLNSAMPASLSLLHDGLLRVAVIWREMHPAMSASLGDLTGGLLHYPIIREDLAAALSASLPAPSTSLLYDAVIHETPSAAFSGSLGDLRTGVLYDAAIPFDATRTFSGSLGGMTNGSLDAA